MNRWFKNNITRKHIIVFVVMLFVFTVLVFLITNAGVADNSKHDLRVMQSTAGAISGPMIGAISRGFQGCCTRASLLVMSFCGPVLLFGILMQFINLPAKKWASVVRMIFWFLGFFLWFFGGIISLGHALC